VIDAAPGHRTLLGFDYGLKRIGIAVGQELTRSARALTTLACPRGTPDWEAITALIHTWHPDALVAGVPRNMDGSAHELTRAAERFARRLGGRYGLPVYTVDERLTSREAERMIAEETEPGRRRQHRRSGLDGIAAQVILQSWLDAQEPGTQSEGG
jgi:putative holliday junction resolvase